MLLLRPFSIFHLPFSIAFAVALICAPLQTKAAGTNDITSLVQRGLFEEEANHDLNAAMQSYESAIKLHDRDRKLAATAIFRLGECYRKQGKTDEANKQYQRIVTEFPDQKELVDVSRSYLPKGANSKFQPQLKKLTGVANRADSQALEASLNDLSREAAKAEALWKHAKDLTGDERTRFFTTIQPDQPVIDLVHNQFEAATKRDKLGATLGREHPEYKAQQEVLNGISEQLRARNEALVWSLDQKYKILKEQEDALKAHLAEMSAPIAKSNEPTTTSEEDEEIRKIKEMIQNSPDLIDAPTSPEAGTPLQKAASFGHLKVAEFLLASGASINVTTPKLPAALLCAAKYGHNAVVELLLQKGADVNQRGEFSQNLQDVTSLHVAVDLGFKTVAETLISHGADVNARNKDGRTPLFYAVSRDNPTIAELLITHGADVNATNSAGMTPLHFAMIRTTPLLLKAGAAINAKSNDGYTPLMSVSGNLEKAKLLLESGATIEDQVSPQASNIQQRGFRPINLAVFQNNPKMLELLLEHGANPNSKIAWENYNSGVSPYQGNQYTTIRGATPLIMAADKIYPDVAEILLSHHADPNITDDNGRTPLHYVISASIPIQGWPYQDPRGQAQSLVKLLLSHGANINAKDNNGTPVIALLRDVQQTTEVVELRQILINAGADENYVRRQQIAIGRLDVNGTLRSEPLFHSSTNGFREFTLLEALACVYEVDPQHPPRGYDGPNGPFYDSPRNKSFPFPDFSRVTISRLGTRGNKNEIKPNIGDLRQTIDCSKDVKLQWGDIIEIPESDHPIDEKWEGLTLEQQDAFRKCLQRVVTVKVKGSTTNLTICPPLAKFVKEVSSEQYRRRYNPSGEPTAVAGFVVSYCWLGDVLNSSGVLLASSDQTRIKVARPNKSAEMVYNLASKDESNLYQMPWLENGDIIEIPERDTASATDQPKQ